jgi:hypothetical protein
LVHHAVTASGGTDWHEPVSDDDYRGASARALTRQSTPTDAPHPTSTPTVPKESV